MLTVKLAQVASTLRDLYCLFPFRKVVGLGHSQLRWVFMGDVDSHLQQIGDSSKTLSFASTWRTYPKMMKDD